MSDEYQPNEVVEPQPELEGMVVDALPEPVPEAVIAEPEVTQEAMPESSSGVEDSEIPVVDAVVMDESDSADVSSVELPSSAAPADEEPSIISISNLETVKSPFAERFNGFVAGVAEFFHGRVWLAAVIAVVLVLVFLFAPPISLAQRLSAGGGYEALSVDNPSTSHSDGLTVTATGADKDKLRLKLSTIPEADFLAGNLPEDLGSALTDMPANLTLKSPYYMLDIRGKVRGPAMMEVTIPNDSEPWETLDLYAWDAESAVWQWIPTQLDREMDVLRAEVNVLPISVVVMQTSMVQQRVAVEAESLPLSGAEAVLTEVDVTGMLIGTSGGLTADATQLPLAEQGGNLEVAPIIRNWASGRDPNWALVTDMLANGADRQAHVDNLLGLAQSGGYPGIVLDYRAVAVGDRDAYAVFVTELGKALHENGIWLALVVDLPSRSIGDTWDTGGYDWYTLGLAVDQLRFEMPIDPRVYTPEGYVEQLFTWAISQVNRYKIVPIFSTQSTDGQALLPFESVLSPVENIRFSSVVTESVLPGTSVGFTLGKAVGVDQDAETGATVVSVGGRLLWLGTPQWLRARLDMVARYHMGGVVLPDLLHEGNMANLLPAIADYHAQVATSSYALPEVTWQVTAPDGNAIQSTTPLSQPLFSWKAPVLTGTYTVAANVAGLDKGSLDVVVATPAPVVTDTVDEDEDGGTTAGEDEDVTVSDMYRATFVSDVTVDDNTLFEPEEEFVKTWRIENSGDENWPMNTVLKFSSGDQMTDADQVAVGRVDAGESKDISVDMVAPKQDGTYKGVWRLYTGDTEIEGGGVTILIRVGDPKTAAVTPTPTTPAPGSVPPVSSGGFELGGHVRDMALTYQDKMHYAGMNWVKVQVHYAEDAAWLVNVAHGAGFQIQISALGSPSMVTDSSFGQTYAGWVAGIAAAGADAIEVWNEPNIEREWQIGHISPQAYTNLLCASYNAIKAANAGTAVISAAPAPTGFFGGCGPNGCDDQPWMEGLYNAGAANCMDYIGAHHNSGATSPSARIGHPANPGDTHHSWFFMPQTELYYNIFRGSRKLFYTEMGYASQEGLSTFSDQFAWARGITNAQQAAWLAEAVQLGISTGMVRCIIVWNIDFVRYGYDPQDGYAIIRPGGSCPACETLHNVLGTR